MPFSQWKKIIASQLCDGNHATEFVANISIKHSKTRIKSDFLQIGSLKYFLKIHFILLFSSAELHISEQNDIAERSGGREARHIVDTPCWQHSQNTIAFPPYSHTRAITKFFRHKQPWTHFQVFLSHNSTSLQIHSLFTYILNPFPSFFVTNIFEPISKFFCHM